MRESALPVSAPQNGAHVIVVGNEKGGSGKSTTAMHVISALLHAGHSVASLDLDARQATLSRYLENRLSFMKRKGIRLLMPTHVPVLESIEDIGAEARLDEAVRMQEALDALLPRHDFLVIDTAGSNTHLTRLGHSYADTLLTPMNDSFVDLDNLAEVQPDTLRIVRPSQYASMVWEQRQSRIQRDRRSIDWIVMRNRLGHLESKNQKAIEHVLEGLARRIGFRLAPGFSERVIFREMFLDGLTLLDLRLEGAGVRLSMSHIAARQEIRQLLSVIGLPQRGRMHAQIA